MSEEQNLPLGDVEAHQKAIRGPGNDRRLRMVFMIEPNQSPLTPHPALFCARSEMCSLCQSVIDEFREAGYRIVDVGVLSPVEVKRVGL